MFCTDFSLGRLDYVPLTSGSEAPLSYSHQHSSIFENTGEYYYRSHALEVLLSTDTWFAEHRKYPPALAEQSDLTVSGPGLSGIACSGLSTFLEYTLLFLPKVNLILSRIVSFFSFSFYLLWLLYLSITNL